MNKNDRDPKFSSRVKPHDMDAEQAVLGGVFCDNGHMDELVDLITPQAFYSNAHGTIYRAMVELYENGSPIDLLTVRDALGDTLDKIGGPVYLAELGDWVQNPRNTLSHAAIVREKAILRGLIAAGGAMAADAYETPSAAEALARAEKAVMRIASSAMQSKARSAESLLDSFYEDLERKFLNRSAMSGLPTGYADLDSLLSGLNRTDLIILAARPGMGKTSFALNVLLKVAMAGTATAFFSLEMGCEQIVQRILAVLGGVNLSNIRSGFIDDQDWIRLYEAGELIKNRQCPLYIDDTPALSPLELSARARRMKKDHDIGLVVIDYLQLMKVKEHGIHSPEQEVAEISGSLKALAKELDIPVIALSQLNRELEKRDDKRPKMSDLRYSGAIEQDADVIMFIYRQDKYGESNTNIAEVLVEKHRNGPCGKVELFFKKECTRFDNLAADDIPSEVLERLDE